jgi:hypothetical protein
LLSKARQTLIAKAHDISNNLTRKPGTTRHLTNEPSKGYSLARWFDDRCIPGLPQGLFEKFRKRLQVKPKVIGDPPALATTMIERFQVDARSSCLRTRENKEEEKETHLVSEVRDKQATTAGHLTEGSGPDRVG